MPPAPEETARTNCNAGWMWKKSNAAMLSTPAAAPRVSPHTVETTSTPGRYITPKRDLRPDPALRGHHQRLHGDLHDADHDPKTSGGNVRISSDNARSRINHQAYPLPCHDLRPLAQPSPLLGGAPNDLSGPPPERVARTPTARPPLSLILHAIAEAPVERVAVGAPCESSVEPLCMLDEIKRAFGQLRPEVVVRLMPEQSRHKWTYQEIARRSRLETLVRIAAVQENIAMRLLPRPTVRARLGISRAGDLASTSGGDR